MPRVNTDEIVRQFGEWNNISDTFKVGKQAVRMINDYFDRERQSILEDIIDCGVMSKDKVLSYLDFFIKLNNFRSDQAIDKWKADRKYIANYRIGSSRKVKVGKIIVFNRVNN